MALTGAQCGLTGVFVFLLNIPFVGVAIAHAAMAGGIWGSIIGVEPKMAAMLGSLLPSIAAGPAADRSKINPNITLGIIFSLAMALAYLGLGMMPPGSLSAYGYLWGSVFLTNASDFIWIGVVFVLVAAAVIIFFRPISAVLFNREIAASIGINDGFIYYMMLFLTGAVVSVNLNIIGGLMLFSLVITPPAIAYQVTHDLKKFFIISGAAGAITGVCGAALSFALNWPVSSSVVIFNSLAFIAVLVFFPKK
jgi:manganese/iron transport system permease protein